MQREEMITRAVERLEAAVRALPETVDLRPITLVSPPMPQARTSHVRSMPRTHTASRLFGFLNRRHLNKAEVA